MSNWIFKFVIWLFHKFTCYCECMKINKEVPREKTISPPTKVDNISLEVPEPSLSKKGAILRPQNS